MHQLILNMLVTKYLANKVLDYIDPCDEILSYIEWEIRASYHHTIQDTPGKYVFVI